MTEISDNELRRNLDRYMDEVVETLAPIVVTRPDGKGNVVLMSEQEYGGWQTTVHLLSSPANAEHLLRGIAAARAGELGTTKFTVIMPTKLLSTGSMP